jgi:thiol-disulfide isomerase/thioredoxin
MDRLDDRQFDGDRLRREGRWAVAFLADWCPFCREFRTHWERWTPPDKVHVAMADLTDLDSELWERFSIEVVPTLVGFRDGVAIARKDGIAGRGLRTSDPEDLGRILATRAGHRID